MFATVRRYEGLGDATIEGLRERSPEIAALLAAVPGTSGSELIRTRDGVILVTVADDEASLVESGRRFVAWVEAHVSGFRGRSLSDVWAGEVLTGGKR